MDDPGLDQRRHVQALCGLARLNRLSRTVHTLWRPIFQLARRRDLGKIRLLDVATGAGDVPLGLWQKARRCGVTLEIHGVDASPRAVQFARSQAARKGAPIEFSTLDVLAGELPQGFDVVVSSLFFHHLDDGQAVALLCRMAGAARHLVLVSDLRRCGPGLALAFLATHLFTRSDVARTDALRSARAAFTLEEAAALAGQAGLAGAAVARRWPFRFLLTWERP